MRYRDRFTPGGYGARAALVAGVALSACCMSLPASQAVAQTGPVSALPAPGTPALVATGATEQIRQIVQCGNTMYAVGTFTEISGVDPGTGLTTTFARNNAFSFSATAPFAVQPWNPNVNGLVNSVALSGDCSVAYLGGQFTTVGGATAKNIAAVDGTVGALTAGFKDNASGQVNTVLLTNSGTHLLVGGFFKGINDSSNSYYASLNPATGKDDGFLNLNISGDYVYKGVKSNSTMVYNQQLSPLGDLLLVEGDFTSVGGLPRQQIFMLNLTGPAATVTGWSSPAWDGSDPNGTGSLPHASQYDHYFNCGDSHPFYIQAAAWAPDESAVYIADTGYKPINWTGTFPMVGICDSVSAVSAAQTEVEPAWTNYDGCNSMYSVAVDPTNAAVYVGGHERWANDQNGCKHAVAPYVNAPGMAGFTTGLTGGSLLMNAANNAGLYSRSRGRGADDMLMTSAGLWIASDNFGGGTSCGGQAGYSGLCFLPSPS